MAPHLVEETVLDLDLSPIWNSNSPSSSFSTTEGTENHDSSQQPPQQQLPQPPPMIPTSDMGVVDPNLSTVPPRKPEQVLRVYSSFRDNFQGSARISQLLDHAATTTTTNSNNGNNDKLRELEVHAYYLPPDDLPIPSLCNLLCSPSGRALEALGFYQLRLGVPHRRYHDDNNDNPTASSSSSPPVLFRQLTRAIGSLQGLQSLTWDPLPSSIWEDAALQDFFLKTMSRLPALKHLYLSLDEQHFSEPQQEPTAAAVPLSSSSSPNHHVPLLPKLMSSLVSLRLSNCSLTMESCHLLAQGLQQKRATLKRLDLSSCLFVETRACLTVVDALSRNDTLQVLDFTDCRFGSGTPIHNSPVLPPQAQVVVYHMLIETLELYNTTLQQVHGTKLWGLCTPPGTMPMASFSCSSILDILLVLNQSGVRAARRQASVSSSPSRPTATASSTRTATAPKTTTTTTTTTTTMTTTNLLQESTTPWPYLLRQVVSSSPTVTFQLLTEQANMLLCTSSSSSCQSTQIPRMKRPVSSSSSR
mmetsp:Transcript_28525/g.66769  ORF Transcript_28525/g.66769 Transcript_28525/m.66769 type:complete len:530 (+) Transcript_28525:299-1888(+)